MRLPAWRGRGLPDLDLLDGAALGADLPGSIGAAIVGLLIAVVVLVLLYVLVLPLVLFVAGLLAAVAGVAARVLLGRPWTIEAVSGGERREWQAVGWRRSGELVDEVAEEIASGSGAVAPEPIKHVRVIRPRRR